MMESWVLRLVRTTRFGVHAIGHVSHAGTARFVFHTLGPGGTPPPPPPYWDIFRQWEQGLICNGLNPLTSLKYTIFGGRLRRKWVTV